MLFNIKKRITFLYFPFVLPLLALNNVVAAEDRDMADWGIKGKYNEYYDLSELDDYKG